MKKNLFTFILLAVALACGTSCNKEEEKPENGTPTTENNVDYQLRVYLTESQLNYLDCEMTINVPGKGEQTYSINKQTNILYAKADSVIDANIIGLSGILDPQPQIYVWTFDYNGLKAGEAKAKVSFSRNTAECKDSAETIDIAIGALWTARTEGQTYKQLENHSSVYGGVYVWSLEEFLQTIGNTFETAYNIR